MRVKQKSANGIALQLFVAGFCATAGYADQLSVTDCSGTQRAMSEVAEGSLTVVEARFHVAGSETGDQATITLRSESSSAEAALIGDKVIFKNVSPGTWKLCPDSSALTLSHVQILATRDGGNSRTASILGGTGILATAGGIAALIADGGSSGSEMTDPTGPALSGAAPGGNNVIDLSPEEERRPSGSRPEVTNDGGLTPPVCAAVEECLNNQEPDPISPFN